MVILKRIDVLSFAKFLMVMYAIIGLINGIFLGGFGMMGTSTFGGEYFAGFGLLAIIILPILTGILGFVGGAIGAVLINFALKLTKGVKVELTSR